VYPDNFFDFQV